MLPSPFAYILRRSAGQRLGLSLIPDLAEDRLLVDKVDSGAVHACNAALARDPRSCSGQLRVGSYVVAVNGITDVDSMLRALERDSLLSLQVLTPHVVPSFTAPCSLGDITLGHPGEFAFRHFFLSGGLFLTVSSFHGQKLHDGWDYLDVQSRMVVSVQPGTLRPGHSDYGEFFVYAFYLQAFSKRKVFGWLPCALLGAIPRAGYMSLDKLLDSPSRDILCAHSWGS